MIVALKESFSAAASIVKLIFPVLFSLEILKYFQLIEPLSILFSPIMELLELPNEFSIIWVIGLFTGVYGAVASFFYIITNPESYSIAEVSILSALILIAHALPVEAKVSQYLGVGYWKTIFFRFFLSIIFALLIKCFIDFFGLLQDKIYLTTSIIGQQETSVISIIVNPIIICIKISLIIILLHLIIEFLKKIKVIYYLEIALKPIATILKIDDRLSSSVLIGIVLGISYGGSLLIKDMKNLKKVSNNEKKKAIYLLNILHSLIEDTILVLLIGANIFIVLFGRILFSIFIMILIDVYYYKFKSSGYREY